MIHKSRQRAGLPNAGQIYFAKSDQVQGAFGQTGKMSLRRCDLEEREEKTLLDDLDQYALSKDQPEHEG